MLGGMPRRGPGPQCQSAQVHLVPVGQSPVLPNSPLGGGGEDLRAVGHGQLPGAGQEVRVQVGVGGERDPQPVPAGRRPHRPQV